MERNIFSSNTPKFKPTNWLILLGIFTVLLLVAWFYLPYALSNHIKKLLIEYGHEDVTISDFNFHPFSGRIIASEITFSTKDKYKVAMQFISVKLSWLPLMDQQILIENILIKDATISISDSKKLPYKKATDVEFVKVMEALFPKQILNSFELGLLEIYKTKIETVNAGISTNYYVDQMTINDLYCCDSQDPVKIEFKGRINNTPFGFTGNVSIIENTLTLTGKVTASGISLANYNGFLNQWFNAIDAQVYLDSDVDIRINDNNFHVKQTGKLKLQKLFAENQKIHFVDEQLNWEGQSEILIGRDFKLISLSANGRILSNDFFMQMSNYDLNLKHKSLRWSGVIETTTNNDEEYDTNISGEFNITDFSLNDADNKMALLAAPNTVITGFKSSNLDTIEATNITLTEAGIAQISTGSGSNTFAQKDALWRSATLHINNWELLDLMHLTISDISAVNNTFYLYRQENKSWLFLDSLPLTHSNHQENGNSKLAFFLNRIKLTSPNKLKFRDDTVEPYYETNIELSDIEFGEITSREQDKFVDTKISGTFDNQAKIVLTGRTQVFSPKIIFQFDGVIRDFPLNSISSYTEKYTNYSVKNGRLDGKFSLETAKKNIKGNSRFFYTDLQVERVKSKNISGFQKNLGISLNSTINHLNNNKNQFKTLLSIEGDLENPEFNFRDTYFNKLGKQLLDKTILRVKKLFRPYNKAINITQAKNNLPSKISLQPIKFTPGNTLLDVKAIEYLDKIISVLTKHAYINVSLCGIASRLDRKIFNRVLNGRGPTRGLKKGHIKLAKLYLKSISGRKGQNVNNLLRKLSKDRVIVTKNYLLSQRAVDKDQIKSCNPSIDNSKSSIPRIDLLL